jgi:hypothetical protein
MSPLVATWNSEPWCYPERVVERLSEVSAPVRAEIGIDGVANHRSECRALAPAAGIEPPALLRLEVMGA